MEPIKILIERQSSPNIKAAVALPNFKNLSGELVELDNQDIQKQLESQLSSISRVISNAKIDDEKIRIKEIKLSFAITASGEVGLFTIAKGGISGTSKIEFSLEFKE